jgi:L-fucose isomerase
MITPKVGFIAYGVHKDGLRDPMGMPFIDDAIVAHSKRALADAGLDLVCHGVVVSTKKEAAEALGRFRRDDTIDAVILFSGTWVWAAHMTAAVREFAKTGKGVLIWTHPGSQGWRPVGGFVLHGALMELGIRHKFVYGAAGDGKELNAILAYCRGAALRNGLNMSAIGAFGGRGMGQSCGVADPSQWMKAFGVDIDSRDTAELVRRAQAIPKEKVKALEPRFRELFDRVPEDNPVNDRSIRLYLALKEIVAEEGYGFYTIQSFPGLADDYAATCFAQSMMLEDGVPTSTLSDFNTAMTVYLLTKLSGSRVYYGDLQHFDKAAKEMKIIGDGAVPPSLACEGTKASFAEHGIPTEGGAGGLSVSLVCKAGPAVLARLGRVDGRFTMVLARCDVFVPSAEELEKRRAECGIPFWPHAFARMRCDMDRLLENWNNEYGCLGYGEHLYDAVVEFCRQADIDVIAL